MKLLYIVVRVNKKDNQDKEIDGEDVELNIDDQSKDLHNESFLQRAKPFQSLKVNETERTNVEKYQRNWPVEIEHAVNRHIHKNVQTPVPKLRKSPRVRVKTVCWRIKYVCGER